MALRRAVFDERSADAGENTTEAGETSGAGGIEGLVEAETEAIGGTVIVATETGTAEEGGGVGGESGAAFAGAVSASGWF